jgi:pSer/pThr/pTyr-binding forkhead associated (FHA) protein
MTANDPCDKSVRRSATVLESVEEIRALVRGSATGCEVVPPTHAMPAIGATEAYRPIDRPSMALLMVIDDGDDGGGETFRLRQPAFAIGRVEGDLVIPHDTGMSGRHAEISRRAEGTACRWYLRDLNSTNGTFARVSQVVLHPGQEVLVGRTRLRFEMPGASSGPAASEGPAATRKWQVPAPSQVQPFLVESTVRGEGRRFPLTEPETWIGRDPSCRVALTDSTADLRHARAFRDPKGRWILANARSVNGLWARVEEIPLGGGGQFQCGEQRFLIKVL